ncbi:hypothetical protein pb186bvf_011105 [Paramecium bursaria]
MEEKINFLVKIKGIDEPNPILQLKARRDFQNIKNQLNIKLRLFLPKEINLQGIPIYYRLENKWNQLSDKDSVIHFIGSLSKYMMVDLSRIKLEYQQLGKNINTLITQISLHSVRVRTLSGSQQEQETNQNIMQEPITTKNSKIRILSSFVYNIQDEMKNKIQSAGQEFQQKLKDDYKIKLQQFNKQHPNEKVKIYDLEKEINQCKYKKEELEKKLKDIMDQKRNQYQLIHQKKELNIHIERKQKEIDELQDKIFKLQTDLSDLGEKLLEKLKNVHINSQSNQQQKPKINKQGSLASDLGPGNSQSSRNFGRRPQQINFQLRTRQSQNIRIHTIYPGNYEIGL